MNEWEWQLLEEKSILQSIEVAGQAVKAGARVRLHPRAGGDVLDLALEGQTAIVEALEQDYEGNAHVCVVLDNDPGRDLGLLRQPGHRFFFDPAEIEPLPPEEAKANVTVQPKILVAGVGNIFLGDDAFGVEVVRRLSQYALSADVRVVDFGIRGFDLAYALQDGYETTILIDAYPHGQQPGTLYVVEPDITGLTADEPQANDLDAHSLDPIKILRMASSMGGPLKRVLLVGCEPATFGPEEGQMGLSEPVERSLEEAVTLVRSVIDRVLAGNWPGPRQ